jgi:hypothetical protein
VLSSVLGFPLPSRLSLVSVSSLHRAGFCQHRYREHATDNWEKKNVFCRAKGCKCGLFLYIPVHGGQDFKCHCKHSHTVHSVQGNRACQRPGCRCDGFSSSFACSCGQFFGDHETIFESRAEREAAGRPVDNLGMLRFRVVLLCVHIFGILYI